MSRGEIFSCRIQVTAYLWAHVLCTHWPSWSCGRCWVLTGSSELQLLVLGLSSASWLWQKGCSSFQSNFPKGIPVYTRPPEGRSLAQGLGFNKHTHESSIAFINSQDYWNYWNDPFLLFLLLASWRIGRIRRFFVQPLYATIFDNVCLSLIIASQTSVWNEDDLQVIERQYLYLRGEI